MRKYINYSAAALVFLSGCVSTRTNTTSAGKAVVDISPKKRVIVPSVIAPSRDIKTIDDLLRVSSDSSEYFAFRNKYQSYETAIMTNIQSGEFTAANALVRNLAGEVEKDRSPFAKEYLKQIKEFRYDFYDMNDVEKVTVSRKPSKDLKGVTLMFAPGLIAGAFFPPTLIVSVPLYLMTVIGGVYKGEAVETKILSELKYATFNKIRVHPYSNKAEIVKKDIPYSDIEKRFKPSEVGK